MYLEGLDTFNGLSSSREHCFNLINRTGDTSQQWAMSLQKTRAKGHYRNQDASVSAGKTVRLSDSSATKIRALL